MPVLVRIFLEVRQSSRLHSTTHTETGMLDESLYYVQFRAGVRKIYTRIQSKCLLLSKKELNKQKMKLNCPKLFVNFSNVSF